MDIRVEHHHYHHGNSATEQKLDFIIKLLKKETEIIMSNADQLAKLQADVTAETTVNQSAITLLQGLKAQLDAAGTDPTALAALSASLEANTQALSDAVTANTPVAAS